MVPECGENCFKETVAIEDIFKWPSTTDRICTENPTECKNHIRITFPDPANRGFDHDGIEGFFKQLGTTDYATIVFIAGSSTAITLILVGIVLGISR